LKIIEISYIYIYIVIFDNSMIYRHAAMIMPIFVLGDFMKKLRGFSILLIGLSLMALGLVLVSCEEPEVNYTVTFDVNGGSGTPPSAQKVQAGFGITLPVGSGLSNSGYFFGGWNTNTSGTGTNYSAGESFTPTANITLYAKWDANYTVTFNVNGGSGTAPSAQTVSPGSAITLPGGSGLSMSGYTFGGWNTMADGTGTNYKAGESFTPTASITLYARWNDRAAGVKVSAPSGTSSVTTASITINPVAAPDNGQTVEYAINTTDAAPSSDWQTGTTFSGLTSGTAYYIFARSAENTGYTAGMASEGYQVYTLGISLNPSGTYAFTAAAYNYGPRTARSVTVSNTSSQDTGELTVALSGTNEGDFTLSTRSINSIAAGGSASFTVVPITGLTAGAAAYTATVTVSGENGISASLDISFTVNKADGAAVSAPTDTSSVTTTSITVDAVAEPSNGQTVEYAISTSNSAPSSGWQNSTTFSDLMYGTSYYVFARSMENANYNAGAASSPLQVTTPTPAGTEDDPFPLTENLWEDGTITTSGGEVWYSFYVAANTTYRVWWNESGSDGTKTLDVRVMAYDSNGTQLFNQDYGWSTPQTITRLSGSTIKLKVIAYSNSYTGTFAVVYSTGNESSAFRIRPPVSHTPLSENQWTDGSITGSPREAWYSFTAVADTIYGVWWNDREYGDSSKTLDVVVRAYDSNGTQLFNYYNGFTNQPTLRVSSGGTIYLRVFPRSGTSVNVTGTNTGTFGIMYGTGFVRPDIGSTALTANQWANGTIGIWGQTWYSFTAAANTTYRVWWNESGSGDGTKNVDVRVTAYDSNGTQLFNQDYGWSTPQTITLLSSSTIYIKVTPYYGSAGGGTFGIVYSTDSTRPAVP
jgi:hypothetical protein